MMKIKTAHWDSARPDFRDTGVRRLIGALSDTRNYATQALDILERYLSEGKLDISALDIQADHELTYALDEALGNEWQKIISGNII